MNCDYTLLFHFICILHTYIHTVHVYFQKSQFSQKFSLYLGSIQMLTLFWYQISMNRMRTYWALITWINTGMFWCRLVRGWLDTLVEQNTYSILRLSALVSHPRPSSVVEPRRRFPVSFGKFPATPACRIISSRLDSTCLATGLRWGCTIERLMPFCCRSQLTL